MRALITGAGGFTGRYLAHELAKAGYQVFGTRTKADGSPPESVQATLECDLCDLDGLRRVAQEVRPDIVANLAGVAFVAHGDANEIYSANLIGARNLLQALSELPAPPRMTLLASSANVYGNADAEVIDESTPPAPTNDYAVSKLAMEYAARLFASRLAIVIARPFNYTGVGQSDKFLIPKIVKHIRDRSPNIELGNLDVARDISDVRMVVSYYHKLLELPEAAGRTVNICSGRAYTLHEILQKAQEISGHRLEVRVNPAFVRANEVKVLRGSRALLNRLVGEAEAVSLNDTLRWMIVS